MARALRIGLLYFLMVGGAGFVLGTIRVLWLLPQVGERTAELLEMPLMLTAIYFAARWAATKLADGNARLAAGVFALTLLLGMELGLVLKLRGLAFAEYVAERDPVSGVVYVASLGFFAVAPALLGRFRHGASSSR